MKKIFSTVVILCISLCLIACTTPESNPNPPIDSEPPNEEENNFGDVITNVADDTWKAFVSYQPTFEINEAVSETETEIELHYTVSDGVVLQRNAINIIRGRLNDQSTQIAVKFMEIMYYGIVENDEFMVYIPATVVGGAYDLAIYSEYFKKTIQVYVGDVYLLTGQSNMSWSINKLIEFGYSAVDKITANNDYIRILPGFLWANPVGYASGYAVSDEPFPDSRFETTNWLKATPENVGNTSAIGYLFAKELQEKTGIPIGLVATAVGGTAATYWMSDGVFRHLNETLPGGIKVGSSINNQPSHGFNALIYSLRYVRFAGALWYQGENNIDHFETYEAELTAIIESYRQFLHRDNMVWFLFELARYGAMSPRYEEGWAQINMAIKRVTEKLDNVFLAQNFEGDYTAIHPMNKKPIALRAANIALNKLYDKESLTAYPNIKSYTVISETKVEIEVENATGLYLKNGSNGFEVNPVFTVGQPLSPIKTPTVVIQGNKITITYIEPITEIRYGYRYRYESGDERRQIDKQISAFNAAGLPLDYFVIKLA